MLSIKRYTFLLAALVAPLVAHAQTAPPAQRSLLDDTLVRFQAERGLDALYNLDFDRADQHFRSIAQRHPDHPIGPFLMALTTWWEILLDLTDTNHDAAFYQQMDDVIARCNTLLRRDPNSFDARFFKGAALGFRGRLRSNRGEYVRAASDGKDAMDYVLGAARSNPDKADFQFGKGIYDYYADVVPSRYPIAKPLMAFLPRGNSERGLRLLEKTAAEGTYLKAEAHYFLAQIYYLFEQDYGKTREHVTWLRHAYPANPFFHAIEARVYARWGYWDEARQAFGEILRRYKQRQKGYSPGVAEQALYYLARGESVRGDHRAALGYLNQLEALSARTKTDTYFKVMGRLRQGLAYDALGQRKQAIARYQQVLKMRDVGRSHEQARRYLEQAYR